jgi:hypothetical protein
MRRPSLRALVVVAALAVLTGLAVPAPAQATTDPLVVSVDGNSWARVLPASLFAGAIIVPGTDVTRTFYVKNQSTETGNLAVALRAVTGSDPTMVAALSIRAVAGPAIGTDKPFAAAAPCVSLVSGITLVAGAMMQVDVRLTLATSLHGKTSQRSVGGFDIPVTLTSTDVPAPSGCTTTVVTPPHNGGTGGNPPGTIGTVVVSGSAGGSALPTQASGGLLSGLGGTGIVPSHAIIPNTGRFWQELDIIGYLIALILGGIFAWRLRRRDKEEEAYA